METMPGGTRARRAGTSAPVASPTQAPVSIASAAAARLDMSRTERRASRRRPSGPELAQPRRHARHHARVPRVGHPVRQLEGVTGLVVELALVGDVLVVLPLRAPHLGAGRDPADVGLAA